MKIVIASDSFKGSLSSLQVAGAMEEGIRAAVGDCVEIVKVGVADGGEGTVNALVSSLSGIMASAVVSDPLGRPVNACYGILDEGKTAVIEMSSASGLPLLTPFERNPMHTTTKGTGELIAQALARGCRKFLIGIGGSATTDGGTGMLSALGWKFYDANGNLLSGCGADLEKIQTIDDTEVLPEVRESTFTIACDVNNPFYGPQGAAFVFAPQKGADSGMVTALDIGLRHFAAVIAKKYGISVDNIPGAGAAGGLGGAFLAFTGAKLVPGIDMVLEAIHFDEILRGASFVFTGEGKIDSQTLHGKTPWGVLTQATRQGIKVIAIGGMVESSPDGFIDVIQATPSGMPLNYAMNPATAHANIRSAAFHAASKYLCCLS